MGVAVVSKCSSADAELSPRPSHQPQCPREEQKPSQHVTLGRRQTSSPAGGDELTTEPPFPPPAEPGWRRSRPPPPSRPPAPHQLGQQLHCVAQPTCWTTPTPLHTLPTASHVRPAKAHRPSGPICPAAATQRHWSSSRPASAVVQPPATPRFAAGRRSTRRHRPELHSPPKSQRPPSPELARGERPRRRRHRPGFAWWRALAAARGGSRGGRAAATPGLGRRPCRLTLGDTGASSRQIGRAHV